MQKNLFLFLIQCIIFFNTYKSAHSKAFIGSGIRVARDDEFKSVVCIEKRVYQNNTTHLEGIRCTGTLVTLTHVLTAEHCFEDLSSTIYLVIYGSVDTRFGKKLHTQWWITFDQWATNIRIDIVHPSNDMAVLKVIKPLSPRMTPSPLCPISNDRLVGLDVVAVGCGFSEPADFPTNIETTDLKIIPTRECERRANTVLGFYYRIPDKDICSVREPFALLSGGDSGGPLLRRNYIIGVASGYHPILYGHHHADQANYYSGINFYRHFINSMISM